MNLTSIINTIRSAIYGKDMREAIAQGFEQIQQDSGKMGGGFVLMEEDIPVGDREENVLYAKVEASLGSESIST